LQGSYIKDLGKIFEQNLWRSLKMFLKESWSRCLKVLAIMLKVLKRSLKVIKDPWRSLKILKGLDQGPWGSWLRSSIRSLWRPTRILEDPWKIFTSLDAHGLLSNCYIYLKVSLGHNFSESLLNISSFELHFQNNTG